MGTGWKFVTGWQVCNGLGSCGPAGVDIGWCGYGLGSFGLAGMGSFGIAWVCNGLGSWAGVSSFGYVMLVEAREM